MDENELADLRRQAAKIPEIEQLLAYWLNGLSQGYLTEKQENLCRRMIRSLETILYGEPRTKAGGYISDQEPRHAENERQA